MKYSPEFALLTKFEIGLTPSEEEVSRSADYLGLDLKSTSLDDRIDEVCRELSRQNEFLRKHVEDESVSQSDEYRRSRFVREVVAADQDYRENGPRLQQYRFAGAPPTAGAQQADPSEAQPDLPWFRDGEMTQDEIELYEAIEHAFADRSMPIAQLIENGVDLGYHLEAQHVDEYFRQHKTVIDRHNSVVVAFIYMNAEASFWLLPLYMKSMLTDYRKDDNLIPAFFDVLAGRVSAYKQSPGGRDLDMRHMATDQEASVVCRFCQWLKRKENAPANMDPYSDAAIKIWCTRPTEVPYVPTRPGVGKTLPDEAAAP